MMQIDYEIEVRPKDMKGVVPLPFRITFERNTPDPRARDGYEWTRIELLIRGGSHRPNIYADVTESHELQDLMQAEYETGRLYEVMLEHDEACDISARASAGAGGR